MQSGFTLGAFVFLRPRPLLLFSLTSVTLPPPPDLWYFPYTLCSQCPFSWRDLWSATYMAPSHLSVTRQMPLRHSAAHSNCLSEMGSWLHHPAQALYISNSFQTWLWLFSFCFCCPLFAPSSWLHPIYCIPYYFRCPALHPCLKNGSGRQSSASCPTPSTTPFLIQLSSFVHPFPSCSTDSPALLPHPRFSIYSILPYSPG